MKRMNKMSKLIKYVLLVITFLVLFTNQSCTSDKQAIKDVVTDFLEAYQNQLYSRCLEYISEELRTTTGDQVLINRLQIARLFSGSSSIKNIGDPVIDGNNASVWIDIGGVLGLTNTIKLKLVKEKGTWMIGDF